MGIKYIDRSAPTHKYNDPVQTVESIRIVAVSIAPGENYAIGKDKVIDELHEYKSDALLAYLKQCTSVSKVDVIEHQNSVFGEECLAVLDCAEVTKHASN